MKILVVAGASGGHIYPALAFLAKLPGDKRISDALLVLPSRSIKADFSAGDYKIVYISSARIGFSLNRKNIIAFFTFLRESWESFLIFIKFKPDLVVGFGSIDSIPLVIFAWFFRVKAVIHEQNVLPGRANRFLAKFVDKVAVSFPESKQYFHLPENKLALTGNPLRGTLKKISKEEALDFLGLDKDKFTILVMGGSQGSRHINSAFLHAIGSIKDRSGIQVIHLLGKDEIDETREAYRKMDIKAKVFNFFSAMEFAYSAANLAVTRAGASTIFELIYFKLPAIILPYPFAHAHQLENAKILSKRGCAVVINESSLDTGLFPETLSLLIKDKKILDNMILNYDSFPVVSAAVRLKDEVLSLI
jgi:UDP-N-acetylglucosamine--N-acetylmuramyl-(pentapeptide) pyrophosphoryl-undecaprenol N-acetylglucosamine transferase